MPANLRDLLTPETKASVESRLLSILTTVGFPVASWSSRNVIRRLLGGFAEVLADWSGTIAAATAGGFRSLAGEGWLDLLGEDFYRTPRNQPVTCVRTLTLTNSATGSSQTITAGTLWAKSDTGLLFTNVGPDTPTVIPPGGSLPLDWRAERPGAAYNIDGSAIRFLVTSVAGVSVDGGPSVSGITVDGTDLEDLEAYRTRLGLRWAALDSNDDPPAAAYESRALSVSPQITRCNCLETTPGPGYVTLYLSSAAGPVPTALVAQVAAAFEANFWRPRCVGLYVYSAVQRTIPLAGTVTVGVGQVPSFLVALDAATAALSARSKGGDTIDLYEVIALIRTIPVVRRAALTFPNADIVLLPHEVPVFTRTGLIVTGAAT